MRTLTLRIIGTTPLILHCVARHQLREHIASNSKRGEFKDKAFGVMSKDECGNPAVPVSWIWDAVRRGCSRIIVDGGKQLNFVKLKQSLHLLAEFIPLRGTSNRPFVREVYTSVQHAAPGAKKMIMVVAPMFKHWALEMPIVADVDGPDDSLLQRIFSEAGRSGIGLFHPPKKQFGQFTAFITPADARLGQVTLSAVLPGLERVG